MKPNSLVVFCLVTLLGSCVQAQDCGCENANPCNESGYCECAEDFLGPKCSFKSQNSAVFDDGNYIVNWAFRDDMIYIQLKAKTTGWVGFMVGSDDMMSGDVMMGNVADGEPTIQDRWSTTVAVPPELDTNREGGVDDLMDKSGFVLNEEWTVLSFSRKTVTNDPNDYDISNDDLSVKVAWAYNTQSALLEPLEDQQPHTNRGPAEINFSSGSNVETEDSLADMAAHGVVMIISWAFIACTGAFIAYSTRKETGIQTNFFTQNGMHKQFLSHKVVQMCAVIGVVIGFILAFVYGHDLLIPGTPKLHIAHGVFGVILTIGIVVQAAVMALCRTDLTRAIHGIMGKILLGVALLWQIPTGALMIWGPGIAIMMWILIPGFWLGLAFRRHRNSKTYEFIRKQEMEKESDEQFGL